MQQNEKLHEYCESRPYLKFLQFRGPAAKNYMDSLKYEPLSPRVQLGAKAFLDLRFYNNWYDDLDLPDLFRKQYVMAVEFVKLGNRFEVEIQLRSVPRRKHIVFLSRQLVHQYIYLDLPRQAVLVDAAFANRYPQVLEDDDEGPNERIALMERSGKRVTNFGVTVIPN